VKVFPAWMSIFVAVVSYSDEVYMVSSHAFAVHFPVALLIVSTGFYLLMLLTRREIFTTLFLWNLALGLAGLAAAVITGQFQIDSQITHGNFHSVFEVHQNLGYSTLSVFYGVFVWYLVRRKKMSRGEQWLLMVVQCVAVWLTIYTAHMGGTLVYEYGAGVKPVRQLQQPSTE
jgi:uncharacterized membrane protein